MNSSDDIRRSLERAVETVTVQPNRGQRTYANTATVCEGTLCRVAEQNDHFLVDIPKSIGGEGKGPSPSMVLRSAITSCVAIGIKQWAARHAISIDRVEVTLETDVDARGQLGVSDEIAPGFLGMRLAINVVSEADPDIVDGIVHKSLKYSPLMDVLARAQVVKTQLALAEPA